MKKTLAELIFADCIFVFLLSFGVTFGGVFGAALYALAFIIPVLLLLYLWRDQEQEIYRISFSVSKKGLIITALFALPVILCVILLSFLFSALMGAIGIENGGDTLTGGILYLILVKALAPSLFEEMLFRYLPLRGLGAHSPRLAVIYSAILFSLSHCNLFQIPYALAAGVAFAALDLAAGSILPSIIIHFLNNVLSLTWQKYGGGVLFDVIFLSFIIIGALLSVALIVAKRKELKKDFSLILEDKSKVIFTYPLIIYVFVTVIAASFILVI